MTPSGMCVPAKPMTRGGYEPEKATILAQGAGEIMVNESLALLEEAKRAN